MAARVLNLDEIEGEPVGGKAVGLARLRRMGLRVPEAVVLVGAEPGALPEDLDARVAVLGDVPLAVRSSAIGEDGEEASFAGQYETVLGVRGPEALRAAIETCLASAESARATAYRDERDVAGLVENDASASSSAVMSVVIQRLVEARASGVCFTADPVSNRRNRLVIDSVAGLGETLVSGHASPDHDQLLRRQSRWEPRQLAHDEPALSERARARVAAQALEAEAHAGEPLDLEWAIDAEGELFWLQARPITTLGFDPQTLDTGPMQPGDVFTRCNVGEMMPGAVSPLTFSTCARGIDVGWQQNMGAVGLVDGVSPENVYIGMSHGHLFINLSEGARFSSAVMGSHPDEQSLAICGRIVPEVVAPAPESLWVRLPRIVKQVVAVLRPKPRLRRMEILLGEGAIEAGRDAAETWRRIDAKRAGLFEAYALHLTVSSGAGALAPILLRILAGESEPSDHDHAVVAHLFSGARDVESADIADGAERLLEAILAEPSRPSDFGDASVETAVGWLESETSGAAGRSYRDYLARHGHRSLRELDVRQPEWAHDPTPLVRSLQVQVRGRLHVAAELENRSIDAVAHSTSASVASTPSALAAGSEIEAAAARFRLVARIAHAAVRNRERGKSLLVDLTRHFKRAYRALALQLVREGRLPDTDAVYFLFHEELGELARSGDPEGRLAGAALERREALAYQETLQFPEVAVGLPEPEPLRVDVSDESVVAGKPVSRGCVEGRVRVVLTLEEAEHLEPGEILVAPITDVGWTPYFAIIAGLVTDVGSAVSHGAVVAREYGLPAVLNTGTGTRTLKTGDFVRLDGDRGRVEVLTAEDRFTRARRAIDAANAEDPNVMTFEGRMAPKELLHAERASHWVEMLDAEPSEALRLAARAHHLRRWVLPRSGHPEGRAGYHAWRRAQKERHASEAAEILARCGYDEAETARVAEIIERKALGRDDEAQALEDALCLVFIETQLENFAMRHPREKVVDILLRSMKKMSAKGLSLAESIRLPEAAAGLLARAATQLAEESEGQASSAKPE